MAYQTGAATSAADLLDKFRIFAEAQGWTTNRNAAAGSGREVCISKGAAFFNFRAYQNETMVVNGSSAANKYGISLNGSDGYDSGSAWDRQPGYPLRGANNNGDQGHAMMPLVTATGPFPSHHFFAPNPNCLYCELEVNDGVFLRFGCGSLDLFNPAAPGGGRFFYATGGSHVTNSTANNAWLGADMDNGTYALELAPFRAADYWSGSNALAGSMVRVSFGSFNNWANSGRQVVTSLQGMVCQGGGCHDKPLMHFSPAPLNGFATLVPCVISLNVGDEFLCPIGTLPGLRFMDMTNYQARDEFTFGPDTWKVFPWYQKGGLSYQRAIAMLKVS